MIEHSKKCICCGQEKPVSDFLRRTGRRERSNSRRGTCQKCRQQSQVLSNRNKRKISSFYRSYTTHEHSQLHATDLRPTWRGFVRMRGKSDAGGRWYQEVDVVQARALVTEGAAVIINPYTIRMLYSNKEFRRYILNRDQNLCYYCGKFGDTIDHLVPRAKGGYTTPANCVCACLSCNQQKGNLTVEQFLLQLNKQLMNV